MSSEQLAAPATPAYDYDLDEIEDEDEDLEDDEAEPLPADEVIEHLRPHLADDAAIIRFLCQFIDDYELVTDLAEYIDERGFGPE